MAELFGKNCILLVLICFVLSIDVNLSESRMPITEVPTWLIIMAAPFSHCCLVSTAAGNRPCPYKHLLGGSQFLVRQREYALHGILMVADCLLHLLPDVQGVGWCKRL